MLGKGFLGLALVITDNATQPSGLPINTEEMMTKGGGQVRGAGGARVQAILSRYGIHRRLSSEGGADFPRDTGKGQSLCWVPEPSCQ